MNEVQSHCEICFSHASTLQRIPQLTTTQKSPSKESQRVKQAIEDNRELLKEMDKDARNTIYDD
tara:strand:+ start:900 stop:1091 length:192 start_codon:yes stop_codon:yes gene_type:complete